MGKDSFSQALPGGYRLGDYVIDRALRQGGFGVTYVAHDQKDGREVVIKENLPAGIACREATSRRVVPFNATDADEDRDFEWALNNFYNEAKLLASLNHPNIVKVLRAFHALGTAYYVMPYVGGSSLDQWVEQNGRPDGGTIIRLMRSLLSALDYMHRHNILHRDVKPSNILMQEDGEPVLIDFGTARHIISERSATKVCSPGYPPLRADADPRRLRAVDGSVRAGRHLLHHHHRQTPAGEQRPRFHPQAAAPTHQRPRAGGHLRQAAAGLYR